MVLVFTIKFDLLKLIADYNFNETNSPVLNIVNDFLDEMKFDPQPLGNKNARVELSSPKLFD